MNNYPQDWDSKLLGKVFPKIVVGYVGNVNDHYCSESEGAAFYRTLNIRDGYFRHTDLKYVTHAFNNKNKKSQISNNDILIARVGANLGMVCKVTGINGLANIANAIIIKTNSTKTADADFFTYFLLSPMGKNQIFSGAAGGAQGVFNTKLTHEIRVPFPPLPEQRKIAAILSTWDKAISTTERLIDNSKQQKKALMQQLLTGKKRLLDDSGKPFEGEWEQLAFGDVVKISSKKYNPVKATQCLPCIELEHIEQESGRIIGSASASNLASIKNHFSAGSVIFGKLRPYLRKFARPNFDGVCSTEIWVFETKSKLLNEYLYHFVQMDKFISEANKSAGSKMPRADWDVVSELVIKIPYLAEQQRIASILTNSDKDIELLQQQLAALKQEKKALMQQLLTGKRRVKLDDKEVA